MTETATTATTATTTTTTTTTTTGTDDAEREREITLDTGRCNGCLGCVGLNPDIFGWDENLDLPYLKRDRATADEVNDALTCCPKQCIALLD